MCNQYHASGGAFSAIAIFHPTQLISSNLEQSGYKISHFGDNDLFLLHF